MGFHVCEYCNQATSSGDIYLYFDNSTWQMPDMILHYIAVHNYLPPDSFIRDLICGSFTNKPSDLDVKRVGYLHGEFRTGNLNDGLFKRLFCLIEDARKNYNRVQTKGMNANKFSSTNK